MQPRIAVGTCGFSYRDWVGPVYPPGTTPGEMLERYAHRFAAVEIDATYYAVPSIKTFASMARRSPPGFRFTAKLPGSATHVPADAPPPVDELGRFRENVQPLIDAGKFAGALAQFPNGFRAEPASYEHIRHVRAVLPDLPLVAEFRHREWQSDATLALLRELGIGFANVDQPQFETLLHPSADVTSDVAYVRFHGRNIANWWRGTNVTRYDYLYTPDELEPWADRIADMAADDEVREVFAFFNNHRLGQAVRNAEMLEAMIAARLGDVLLRPPPGPREPEPLSLFDEPGA